MPAEPWLGEVTEGAVEFEVMGGVYTLEDPAP